MRDPAQAVVGATAVYTDVWTSMGQEAQQETRTSVFSSVYQVNDELLKKAAPGCLVLHCLPARERLGNHRFRLRGPRRRTSSRRPKTGSMPRRLC